MTCIIALRDKDKVFIGYDSFLGNEYRTSQTRLPKVIKCHNMYIGLTGYPRGLQIIQYHLSVRTQNENEDDIFYLVTVFADGIRRIFKELGYSWVNSNHEYSEDVLVIVYHNQLYKMDTNYQITQTLDDYVCIGSGEDYALAAMEALNELDAKKRIKRSLEITTKFCTTVTGPFKVMECSV